MRAFACLFSVVVVAAVMAGGARSGFPGRAGLVVSSVSAAEPPRLFELDPRTGGVTAGRVAPELASAREALWAPDGRRVAVVRLQVRPSGFAPAELIYVGTRGAGALRFVAVGSSPVWSPDGRRLAFFRPELTGIPVELLRSKGVFVADVVRGTVRRAASGGGPPAWSPDGKRIVYGSSRLRGARPGLWVVSASGGRPRRIARSVSVSVAPAWAPSGNKVAFVDDRNGRLKLLDLRTSRTAAIARNASAPLWSPNGAALAYLRSTERSADAGGLLHVVRADGRRDRKFALAVGSPGSGPPSFAWSHDGSEIATVAYPGILVLRPASGQISAPFVNGSTSGWGSVISGIRWTRTRRILFAGWRSITHIAVSAPDGSGQRLLTTGRWSDVDPVWSADGTEIAFASDRDGDYELNIMRADGSGLVQLTDNQVADRSPSWAPDGTQLAFSRPGKKGSLWTIGSDGRGARLFATGYAPPLWSPDGRFIAYNRCDAPAPSYACPRPVIAPADTTTAGCTVPVVAPGYAAVEWSRDAALLHLDAMKVGGGATVDTRCGNWQPFVPNPSHWSPDGRSVRKIAGDWQALCTITGSESADTIVGTEGDDVICGLGGDDVIDGRGGHDILYGGPGNDTLTGGPGADWLFGAAGDDTLSARDGEADIVNGGPGTNRALADDTDDVIHAIRQT